MAGGGLAGHSLSYILLTTLRHVNRQRPKSLRGAFKMTHLAVSQAPLGWRINRAAQNGSRTLLKMLTLLRCIARQPFGTAVGFFVLGVHV
jgi:hypothetical protein